MTSVKINALKNKSDYTNEILGSELWKYKQKIIYSINNLF